MATERVCIKVNHPIKCSNGLNNIFWKLKKLKFINPFTVCFIQKAILAMLQHENLQMNEWADIIK